MDASAGRIKGTILGARLKYARTASPDAVDRILDRLPEADRAVLRRAILPSSWYPADLLERLDAAIAAVLAQGNAARLYRDLGRYNAETNLGPGGVQRPYVREGDPHFLLGNTPRMYSTQRDVGERTYERTGDRAAILKTLSPLAPPTGACESTIGFVSRGIELSGGKDVQVVETRCRGKGADCCEFRCTWR